jgi:DNA-binding helix-hairpin-helix protein with protein kinase domain
MIRLYCADNGESIELIEEINNSGEGRIYKTSKDGFLAKIYHKITKDQIQKLKVMVDNPPTDPTLAQGHISIAWPKCLLRDKYYRYLGFLMPQIKDARTLINVYNPSLRGKNAPGFNWLYLHITAMNIAFIMQAIHAKNYVVCDIKPQNILVNQRGLVSIIDTDSFQIVQPHKKKIYHSPVGSPEFTPPEMFNVDLKTVERTEFQDRFGLAVVIWQLLFGNHPFSGQWVGNGNQPNIDKLIHQGHWIYGSNSLLRPSQLSMPLNILHPDVQQCFLKCFNNGLGNPYERPSAEEWQKALESAVKDLVTCYIEFEHVYAKSYGKCYWCERKEQLNFDIFAPVAPVIKPVIFTQKLPYLINIRGWILATVLILVFIALKLHF